MISQWEKTLHGCWGRNGILKKMNQASRRKKAYHKGILVIQRWFNIPMNIKFIFVTRVTRLIHNAGKYLLISIYPLPTNNFTHKDGGNLDTLPGWPKKKGISIDLRVAQVNKTSYLYNGIPHTGKDRTVFIDWERWEHSISTWTRNTFPEIPYVSLFVVTPPEDMGKSEHMDAADNKANQKLASIFCHLGFA